MLEVLVLEMLDCEIIAIIFLFSTNNSFKVQTKKKSLLSFTLLLLSFNLCKFT